VSAQFERQKLEKEAVYLAPRPFIMDGLLLFISHYD